MRRRAPLLAALAMLCAVPSGAEPRALMGLSSCVPIQGAATIYLSLNTCADAAEVAVAMPVKALASLTNLSCRLSGTTGSATVTITTRVGTCAALADTAFVCTIGASGQACDTAGTFQPVTPGQCVAWQVVISGAMPAPRYLTCTLERAA